MNRRGFFAALFALPAALLLKRKPVEPPPQSGLAIAYRQLQDESRRQYLDCPMCRMAKTFQQYKRGGGPHDTLGPRIFQRMYNDYQGAQLDAISLAPVRRLDVLYGFGPLPLQKIPEGYE